MENTSEALYMIVPDPPDYLNPLPSLGFMGDVSVKPLTAAVEIEAALTQVNQQLTEFVASANFEADLQTAFGEYTDVKLGATIIEALAESSQLPDMIVVSSDLMNGVNGGFDSLTGTVYLSDAIINSEKLVDVITEEFGHYIDFQLNEIDSPGDEGELFMRLVNGEVLSEVDLTYLRNKDDRVMILGGLVEVEANEDIVIDNPANLLPEMSIADTEITEGDRGRSFAEFKVTLDSPSDQTVKVSYTTADGTATVADRDYEPTSGDLVFRRGQTERVIRVPVFGDTKVEPDETFKVILSEPENADLGRDEATGTILNDDGLVSANISIADTQIMEGNRGRSFAEFKVTLDSPSNQIVRVNYATADGTATVADRDYERTRGELIFPRGQTERVIRVPVIGDTKVEPDETFQVILSDPQNAELERGKATGTILDDDDPERGNTLRNPFVLGNLTTDEIVRTDQIGFIKSGKRDVNDYYRFRLTRPGTVTINLDDLVANANLQLLGSGGELIDQSNNPGTQAETIMQRDLEPGIYYARVHPHVSDRTKYRLSINLIS
ncbi:Calx-beta domain-containing protein [Limnospira platensis CENA597]|uniref:Calx-beta domain-containing protein n=1 Tax=Limnospira platensis TaxID=118562 RepID=UPI003D9FEC64